MCSMTGATAGESGADRSVAAAQLPGRSVIEGAEGIVESAQAAESCRHGNLRHRELRVMNQLFGEEHAPRLRDRDGRGAEVLFKKPAQLTFSHPDASRQGPRQSRPLDQESLRRSAPMLGRRYSRCRANRPVQERSRAGSEGMHESRPPARQRRSGRIGSSPAWAYVPDRSDGSRSRWR